VTGPERVEAAVRAGAHGVAVVRGVMAAADPAQAARALHAAMT
jgi:thiamine monophosphate synthase